MLKIYKASAGSGKTFQITSEYLQLVFGRKRAYKNILAVTFTNKATAEMKGRILRELHLLANGEGSAHLDTLREVAKKSEAEIRQEAASILKHILHDYSHFSISTIDSFFQKIVRAFSREMNIRPSHKMEINKEVVFEEAIDRIFFEIGENENIKNWLHAYADENIRKGLNWDFREEMLNKGEDIFSKGFRMLSGDTVDLISNKVFLAEYTVALKEIVSSYEVTMQEIGSSGLELMDRCGLKVTQFKYGKSSFASYFNKLVDGKYEPSKRVESACNNLEGWYKKSDSDELKERISNAYEVGLNKLILKALSTRREQLPRVNTANAILPGLYVLGILADLAIKVKEVAEEKGLLLIDDVPHYINDIVDGDSSSFIYEKMGSIFRHFMLDEFQDTSGIQWQNFAPLVKNSLSEGNLSLVVGDVKQSIYRWRDGDWDILATQLENEYSSFGTNTISLGTNWRSSKNVIGFNNIIFRECAKHIEEELEERLNGTEAGMLKGAVENAYADHYQSCSYKSTSNGYVEVKFVEGCSNKNEFREDVLERLVKQVEDLQEKGCNPGDIAILVRSKREGEMVVKAMLRKKYKAPRKNCCYNVVSGDSLKVEQSATVRFVVLFLTMVAEPQNEICVTTMMHEYFNCIAPLISDSIKMDGNCGRSDAQGALFPEDEASRIFADWISHKRREKALCKLKNLSLYDLVGHIISEFQLHRATGEWVFLQAFLDILLEYTWNEMPDIVSFLNWWESTGKDQSISAPEDQNAVNVLTIHKSKGLEFKVVFVPFCDWKIFPEVNKARQMWCKPRVEPFNRLEVVPVKFSKELKDSFFSEEYCTEMVYSAVDNLNLMYVAFTRAVDFLFIYCQHSEDKSSSGSVSEVLQSVIEQPPLLDSADCEKYISMSDYWNSSDKKFKIGELGYFERGSAVRESGCGEVLFTGRSDNFKIKLNSEGYSLPGDDDRLSKMNRGRHIHEVLERIVTADDIAPVIKRCLFEGRISVDEASMLEKGIRALVYDEKAKEWFSGKWKVLAERNILRPGDKKRRPDRIMVEKDRAVIVDYKTGGVSEKHFAQVKEYINDLLDMGFAKVSGYVWYIDESSILEVE